MVDYIDIIDPVSSGFDSYKNKVIFPQPGDYLGDDGTLYVGDIMPFDPGDDGRDTYPIDTLPTAPDGQDFGFYDLLRDIFGFMSGSSTGEDLSSSTDDLMKDYMKFIRENTDYNNAWSAEQAQKQMDFQFMSQKLAQRFNRKEAAKNRNWQEYMSNTAHQREIADLKAAGLNPILSATGGNGAAVTSGATAAGSVPTSGSKGDTDLTGNSAITSLFGSMFSAITNIASSALNAQTQMGVADKYTQMYELIEKMQEAYKEHEHEKYPDTMWETIASLITATLGGIDTVGVNIREMFDSLLDKVGKTPDWLQSLIDKFTGSGDDDTGTGSEWHGGDGFGGRSGKIRMVK